MSGLTTIRVRENRALSLLDGVGVEAISTLHLPGAELELPEDEAAQLEADGFVERVNTSRSRASDNGPAM